LTDSEMQRIECIWDIATPEEKLAWFNEMALRPVKPWHNGHGAEILELANYFKNQSAKIEYCPPDSKKN